VKYIRLRASLYKAASLKSELGRKKAINTCCDIIAAIMVVQNSTLLVDFMDMDKIAGANYFKTGSSVARQSNRSL